MIFTHLLKRPRRISAASEKANEEEVPLAKASYLGLWSAMGGYTRELWRASQPTISWPLSARKQEKVQFTIPILSKATMDFPRFDRQI